MTIDKIHHTYFKQIVARWGSEQVCQKKKTKRMDEAGIEPATFRKRGTVMAQCEANIIPLNHTPKVIIELLTDRWKTVRVR